MKAQLQPLIGDAAQPVPAINPLRSNLVQRRCSCGGTAGYDGECETCRRTRLRRKPSDTAKLEQAPPIVHDVLRSPGQPLDAVTRASMEPRFGHDFGRVRVHTDDEAAEAARSVGALAFTVGRNLVFGAGQYSPNGARGRRLLAHELTHVVQQHDLPVQSHPVLGADDEKSEHEAEAVATSIVGGGAARAGALAGKLGSRITPGTVQRYRGPVTPGQEEAARELVKKSLSRTVGRAGWRQFWRAVVRRFALRGAMAVLLAGIDGPLPVGDLIALGLTLWTVWEIVSLWDELWREAEHVPTQEPAQGAQQKTLTQPRTQTQSLPRPQLRPHPDQDVEQERRCGCRGMAVGQRGGNSCHDRFATSVSGVGREWGVETPEGLYADFDARGRDGMLYEIKTGYRFLLNTSPSTYRLRERHIHQFIDQSQNQLAVATRCGYSLVWVFNDPAVASLVDGSIQPPVEAVPFDCDEDR